MVNALLVVTCTVSSLHLITGLVCLSIAIFGSVGAESWLARSVSPIWSGAFFVVTGLLGFICAVRRSAYLIMCFAAFSVVSLVTAVVVIQLLRLGLNHHDEVRGEGKQTGDILVIVSMCLTGIECLFCIMSSVISCRLARQAKHELQGKREGTFHVQELLGEKELIVTKGSPRVVEKT